MLLPIVLGLSAAMILAGCTAPPSAYSPPEPQPDPELPEENFTPAARGYYRRLIDAGYSSRRMDHGYLLGPWHGRYFSSHEVVAGSADRRIDGLEVYLAVLDFSEADPSETMLQGMLQEIIADPAARLEFSLALTHSPERRKSRLWMAESLLRWSLRETRNSSYLWFFLGAVQERLGELYDADFSYRSALRRQEGMESYSTLMTLANLQRRLRRPGLADAYEERARELTVP